MNKICLLLQKLNCLKFTNIVRCHFLIIIGVLDLYIKNTFFGIIITYIFKNVPLLRLCKAVVFRSTLVSDFRVKITNVNSCTLYLVATMVASIFLLLFIVQAIAEKRILLNDPALLQSQMHALES